MSDDDKDKMKGFYHFLAGVKSENAKAQKPQIVPRKGERDLEGYDVPRPAQQAPASDKSRHTTLAERIAAQADAIAADEQLGPESAFEDAYATVAEESADSGESRQTIEGLFRPDLSPSSAAILPSAHTVGEGRDTMIEYPQQSSDQTPEAPVDYSPPRDGGTAKINVSRPASAQEKKLEERVAAIKFGRNTLPPPAMTKKLKKEEVRYQPPARAPVSATASAAVKAPSADYQKPAPTGRKETDYERYERLYGVRPPAPGESKEQYARRLEVGIARTVIDGPKKP